MFFNPLQRLWRPPDWPSSCLPELLSISLEETMKRRKISSVSGGIAILTTALALGIATKAQEQSQETSREAATQTSEQPRQKADGERHGLPIETYAVVPGTKFLGRLEDELGTKGTKKNERVTRKTLGPLEADNGMYLPAGGGGRRPIRHIEPPRVAGEGKLCACVYLN